MRSGTIVFLLGVVALQFLPQLPDARWSWLIPALLSLAWWRPARLPALLVIGFLWALWHADARMQTRLPAALEGRTVQVEGTVEGIPRHDGHVLRFVFTADHGLPTAMRLRLSWYRGTMDLRGGERWRLVLRLRRPHGFRNPSSFDYEGWLFRRGYDATGYVLNGEGNGRLAAAEGLHHWRQVLADRVAASLPGNPFTGMIQALSIGERQGMDTEQWTVLRRTGTGHLMAISGLHIGLVATAVFFVTRRLWGLAGRAALKVPAPKAAAVSALAAAAAYAALAGFAIPTRRALVMLMVVMGAVLLQRELRPGNGLALALLAVLLTDPLAVLEPGFWLSFGAVTLIVFAMAHRPLARGWWWRWGRLQWVLAVGLAPLTLAWFGGVPLISAPANLIAVPWVGLMVVPLVLAGVLVSILWTQAGTALLTMAARLLEWLWTPLAWLSELPMAHWTPADVPMELLWALFPAVVLLLAPRGLPGRWLGAVLLLPVCLYTPERPPLGGFWLTVLDVGHGLAAVVETANRVIVFDTGPRYSSRFDAGSGIVAPFLRGRGYRRMDLLVVSHGDSDHAGGVRGLLGELPAGRVLSGDVEALAVPVAGACREGMEWSWDGVRFRFLNPPRAVAVDENEGSCVLSVEGKGGRLLLTADIERGTERRLVAEYGAGLAADVLLVPHHGSGTSSTRAFVDAVSPALALVPVDHNHRFGLPREEVLQRYRRAGAAVFQTGQCGALTVRVEPDSGVAAPRAYRLRARRYWHATEAGECPGASP